MFLPLLTGLGLSASAGMNAYLPLIIIAMVDRIRDGDLLSGGYEFISSIPAVIVLLVLITIELVADKSPAYRANDVLQSIIRPAAGALAFMASASNTDFNLVAALLIGLVVAGVIHATKSAFRLRFPPKLRAVFVPAFSVAEDLYAAVMSTLALVIPIIVPVLLIPAAGIAIWTLSRRPDHGPAITVADPNATTGSTVTQP